MAIVYSHTIIDVVYSGRDFWHLKWKVDVMGLSREDMVYSIF
jgi:hypothetical protein